MDYRILTYREGRRYKDGKRVEVLKPESEWVYKEVEPIVSEDLRNQCNALLDERRQVHRRPSRKTVHLFSGIVRCACEGKMYVPTRSRKYVCASCRSKTPVEDLEVIYHNRLKEFHFSPTEIDEYTSKAHHVMREREELVRLLQSQQTRLQRDIDKLFDLYLADKHSKDGFGRKYQPLEAQLQQVEDQLPVALAELDVLKVQSLGSEQLISEAQDLYSRWDVLSRDDKRHVVEMITENIVIDKDEIRINLCYLPPLESVAKGHRTPREPGRYATEN